jgi:hypothetical protein
VLLGGEGAGFFDMVGLSALSLLILLVGAVALFVSESDDADSMDGLCKGAGEEEEDEDAVLRIVDGC